MQHQDLTSLTAQLLWGTAATRQQLAEQLLRAPEQHSLELLAATVRSRESWRLRSRCLEVLGLVAGRADEPLAERIVELLVEGATGLPRGERSATATHDEG